jgi:hypothetical protein
VQYESLPPTLTIHLKRFRFDPVSEHTVYRVVLPCAGHHN